MFRFDLQRFALTLTASPANISIMAGGMLQTVTLTAGGIEDNLLKLPMSKLNSTKWGGGILITNRIVLRPMVYTFKMNEGCPSWVTLSTGSNRTRVVNIQPGSTVTAGSYTIRCTVSCSYQPSVHGGVTTEYADATITVAVNSQPA